MHLISETLAKIECMCSDKLIFWLTLQVNRNCIIELCEIYLALIMLNYSPCSIHIDWKLSMSNYLRLTLTEILALFAGKSRVDIVALTPESRISDLRRSLERHVQRRGATWHCSKEGSTFLTFGQETLGWVRTKSADSQLLSNLSGDKNLVTGSNSTWKLISLIHQKEGWLMLLTWQAEIHSNVRKCADFVFW